MRGKMWRKVVDRGFLFFKSSLIFLEQGRGSKDIIYWYATYFGTEYGYIGKKGRIVFSYKQRQVGPTQEYEVRLRIINQDVGYEEKTNLSKFKNDSVK